MIITQIKTQAKDTPLEIELLQFQLWRNLTRSQKLNLVQRIAQKGIKLAIMGIKHQFPNISDQKIKELYLQKRYNCANLKIEKMLINRGKLMLDDPISLAYQLAQIFEKLKINYYIGGSVASSLQGEVRFTEDLDLVINLNLDQVETLIKQLETEFYLSEIAIKDALEGKTESFNIIHLQTIEKADLFISQNNPFEMSKMARRQLYISDEKLENKFYVSSPEDTFLQKLLWFKKTNHQSQKQWRDLLGILKLQNDNLDLNYLKQWAKELNLLAELKQALTEAGINY